MGERTSFATCHYVATVWLCIRQRWHYETLSEVLFSFISKCFAENSDSLQGFHIDSAEFESSNLEILLKGVSNILIVSEFLNRVFFLISHHLMRLFIKEIRNKVCNYTVKKMSSIKRSLHKVCRIEIKFDRQNTIKTGNFMNSNFICFWQATDWEPVTFLKSPVFTNNMW